MFLRDTVNVEAFAQYVRDGYISRREGPDGLSIFCYTRKVMEDGKWCAETKSARGLVLSINGDEYDDARVYARGLPKFFTAQQHESGWGVWDDDEGIAYDDVSIDDLLDLPATCVEKVDGAMIGAFVINDTIRTFTKGTFNSDEAIMASDMIEADPNIQRLIRDLDTMGTPIFEIVSRSHPHVVDYNVDALYFISVVTDDGRVISNHLTLTQCADYGVRKPKVFKAGENRLRDFLSITDGDGEGFVVFIGDSDGASGQRMLKVKFNSYMRARMLRYSMGKLHSIVSMFSVPEIMSWHDEGDVDISQFGIPAEYERLARSQLWEKLGAKIQRIREEIDVWTPWLAQHNLSPSAETASMMREFAEREGVQLQLGFVLLRGQDINRYIKRRLMK